MRLAPAILLGSKLIRPRARGFGNPGSSEGCAIGMAVVATGDAATDLIPEEALNARGAVFQERWPWVSVRVLYPCSCCPGRADSVDVIITHLFDYHVIDQSDWTIEQLADWVESVDKTSEGTGCQDPNTRSLGLTAKSTDSNLDTLSVCTF